MNYMIYKSTSLAQFEAWSGGRDTLNTLIERGDCRKVQTLIEETFNDHTPEETEINDFLWFERDMIAEHLGYADWDAYERDEQDEDEGDGEPAEDWAEHATEVLRERFPDATEDEIDYFVTFLWENEEDEDANCSTFVMYRTTPRQ